MKIRMTRIHRNACTLGLSVFALSQAAAKDVSVLELAKEGNRYLGEQSATKSQIHSDKSIAGLTPDVWHVVITIPT
jgi:hypothetical protein